MSESAVISYAEQLAELQCSLSAHMPMYVFGVSKKKHWRFPRVTFLPFDRLSSKVRT